jgi:hypothetical protein
MSQTWLENLLKSTDELESPKAFWFWAGLSTIAAVVKDNVWIDRGGAFKQYCNIYVMLLARSGLRKGPPINLAKRLVTKTGGSRIIVGRSSIQAILKDMGTATSAPGGKLVGGADAFILASELSASFVDDKATMDILTDMYDRIYNEGEWKSLLKMESFTLNNPIVSMLVGTNNPHFKNFFMEKDVQGGFIGRMFVIAESKKHRTNSLYKPLEFPLDDNLLVPHLKELAKLRGPFKQFFPSEAGEIFDKWYNELDAVYEKVEDKTGTLERIGESVIKVAMLLSLARSTDLIISTIDMNQAIEVCQKLVGNIRKHTLSQGSTQSFAEQKTLIIEELMSLETHQISQERLLSKYWMHFNLDQLTQIMASFAAAGLINTETLGNKLIYIMPDDQYEKLKRFMEGK